jgi:hypothetical protein
VCGPTRGRELWVAESNPDDDQLAAASVRASNVIAEALAALMASRAIEDHSLEEAATRLRDAVGLEERH